MAFLMPENLEHILEIITLIKKYNLDYKHPEIKD